MRIDRAWAMPNKWTFTIPPIAQLIKEEMADTRPWIDPFAGLHSPAHVRNDLNPDMPAEYHMDALEFLRLFDRNSISGILIDPPYSQSKIEQHYDLEGVVAQGNTVYFSKLKREVYRLLVPNGKAICCWWHSNGIRQNNTFELERVLLVAHGGNRHDTIVTVERKVQESLV